jgi:hypothetical protein
MVVLLIGLPFVLLSQASKESATNDPPRGDALWNVTSRYIGSKQCAQCHPTQAKHFHENSMSRALEPVDRCKILEGAVHFSFVFGPYTYTIKRSGEKVLYQVADDKDVFVTELMYAFGQGKAGQTYVYNIDGAFYESRVSYYAQLNALDLTVGATESKPSTLREAAGRLMDSTDSNKCFGCHTTGARIGNSLQLKSFEAGVQCESCHGPGGAHVDSIRDGKPAPHTIRSLKGMDPQQANEMCGTCHRTWETVMIMGLKGPNNARFPPYRLTNSACFSLDDRRISCLACHNPHEALVSDDKAYDSKCAACHNASNESIKKKVCPVAKEACTSCHMPRIKNAEAHHSFPDHWIRVARASDAYPD